MPLVKSEKYVGTHAHIKSETYKYWMIYDRRFVRLSVIRANNVDKGLPLLQILKSISPTGFIW